MAYFTKAVSDFVKTTFSTINPYKIEEITNSTYSNDYKKYELIEETDTFYLYKIANHFECIYFIKFPSEKIYSLFRIQKPIIIAKKLYNRYRSILSVIPTALLIKDKTLIERVCNNIHLHDHWTSAHLMAHLEVLEVFRTQAFINIINDIDEESGVTPMHIAVSSGNIDLVKEILLIDKVDLNILDKEENSILHLAAVHESSHILNLLLNKTTQSINTPNLSGRTVLHIACEVKSRSNVELLLRYGADPSVSKHTEYPIHVAMRLGLMDCIDLFYEHLPDSINQKNGTDGSTIVHMVQNKTDLVHLIEIGVDINNQNNNGMTLLHVKVQDNDFNMVFAALICGADPKIMTNDNQTPLHFAIKDCDVDIIRVLIVFEVDVNIVDKNGETARHRLCKYKTTKYQHSKQKDIALYTLHAVGAIRCQKPHSQCTEGCMFDGDFNGKPPTLILNTVDHSRDVLDEALLAARRMSTLDQQTSEKNQKVNDMNSNAKKSPIKRHSIIDKSKSTDTIDKTLKVTDKSGICSTGMSDKTAGDYVNDALDNLHTRQHDYENQESDWYYLTQEENCENLVKKSGIRLLALDGGGIRGLILVQTLRALERVSGKDIQDMFDWIGGTSTGGLLAISIVHGMSLKNCRIMYIKMKDEVFVGKRPYSTDYLEKVIKDQVGETATMTAVTSPKLTVTALHCDRFPPKLHLFRNYEPPLSNYKKSLIKNTSSDSTSSKKNSDSYLWSYGTHDPATFNKDIKHPSDQLIWEVAKATGAAPTFFRAAGSYLDGGLISNNPTLDLLTEITEYNLVLSKQKVEEVEPLSIVVSIGTGRIPLVPISNVDVFRPNNPLDIYNIVQGMSILTKVIVEMATSAEGQVVDRARAWCHSIDVPFFRFSPPLSNDIPLDEVNDKIIIEMLWETEAYLYRSKDRLKALADLL